MDTRIKGVWVLEVTSEEMRIILRALRGTMTEEDRVKAEALGELITAQRATSARQLVTEMDKHLFNSEQKGGR